MDFLKSIAKSILKTELEELNTKISELNSKIVIDNPKEAYYRDKYPKVDIFYQRTDKLGTIKIDVRQFLNWYNCLLPIMSGSTDDEKALNSLLWVVKNIAYTSDKKQYGLEEYWSYNYETINHFMGDCEDLSILLYCIMRYNNIPYWKIRVTAGEVNDNLGNFGGHCWISYYCESEDKWVLLDPCYWTNKLPIKDRKDYKDETYYKTTWFSFNELYSYSKDVKDIPKYGNVVSIKSNGRKK